MPDVTFSVASRRYTLRCAAGQEGHLQQVAALLDQRVQPLASAVPGADDRQLLVIAAIALLDELQAASDDARAGPPPANPQGEESAALRSMAESLQADCEALRAENAALRLWAESMSSRLTMLSGSLGALAEAPAAD